MSEWVINAGQFRTSFQSVVGPEATEEATIAALDLATRIARESGKNSTVSLADLGKAGRDALAAMAGPPGSYHYLLGHRQLTAATLITLRSLVDPKAKPISLNTVAPANGQDAEPFKNFLRTELPTSAVQGIVKGALLTYWYESIPVVRDALTVGPLESILPFEKIGNVSIPALIISGVEVFRGLQLTAVEEAAARGRLSAAGLPEPLEGWAIAAVADNFENFASRASSNAEFSQIFWDNPGAQDDAIALFRYIAAFGHTQVAKQAAEVVTSIETAALKKSTRSQTPEELRDSLPLQNFPRDTEIGESEKAEALDALKILFPSLLSPTPTAATVPTVVPRVSRDFAARKQQAGWFGRKFWGVMEIGGRAWDGVTGLFRKKPTPIAAPLTQSQAEDEAFNIFRDAWNNKNIKASDIITDLDDVVLIASVMGNLILRNALKGENMYLRKLIIAYVALTIRDGEPLSFATHTCTSRLTDLLNEPRLKGLRAALFPQWNDDTPITNREIEDMESSYTFASMTLDHAALLREFKRTGYDLNSYEARIQAAKTRGDTSEAQKLELERLYISHKMVVGGSNNIRGSKSLTAHPGKYLIDDKLKNGKEYVLGGGKGAVVTGPHNDFEPQIILRAIAFLNALSTKIPKRFVLNLEKSDAPQNQSLIPDVFVTHRPESIAVDYAYPVYRTFAEKFQMFSDLLQTGKYGETLRTAKNILKKREQEVVRVKDVTVHDDGSLSIDYDGDPLTYTPDGKLLYNGREWTNGVPIDDNPHIDLSAVNIANTGLAGKRIALHAYRSAPHARSAYAGRVGYAARARSVVR